MRMCPMSPILYSTTKGTSGLIERETWGAKQLALVNMLRYRQAKVNVTGSCISIETASSSLSTLAVCANLMFPTPISPAAENLTPSLVQEMTTDSPNWLRSLMTLWNSAEGFLIKVHQLHFVISHLFLIRRLEHEGDGVCLILSFYGDDIVGGGTSQDF